MFNFLLFFTLFVFSNNVQTKTLDQVVAIVDDSPVLQSDVESLLAQLKKSSDLANLFGMRGVALNESTILNKIIEEKIIRSALKSLSSEVEDSEVTTQIKGIADQNGLSIEGLKNSLEKDGVPFVTYQRCIRSQLEKRRIFDREVRKTSATLSDVDLKAEFLKSAPKELELGMLVDSDNAKNKALLMEISKQINNGALSSAKVKDHPLYQELGWIDPQSINPSFREALKNVSVGKSSSIVNAEKKIHLLVVLNSRQGSDEQFESQKERIRSQLMANDSELRFASWINKKKEDLQVIVNK